MKIWQLKSLFDHYKSFQLLNLKEDRKNISMKKLIWQ